MPTVNLQLDIPVTESPVPTLCSIHTAEGRGGFGDAKYRGNCSGLLVRDLLQFYEAKRVLDPMEGSGTCRDVAKSLSINCEGFDLSKGFDATDAKYFFGLGEFDFVWLHPPYSDLMSWTKDSRCLSKCKSVPEFVERLYRVIRNCLEVLSHDGHMAILIGDVRKRGKYYALPFHVWQIATKLGLELAAPEIIRPAYGATSTGRSYSFAFVPRVHDVCMVFRRRNTVKA